MQTKVNMCFLTLKVYFSKLFLIFRLLSTNIKEVSYILTNEAGKDVAYNGKYDKLSS